MFFSGVFLFRLGVMDPLWMPYVGLDEPLVRLLTGKDLLN
jgi:hypothetical protein